MNAAPTPNRLSINTGTSKEPILLANPLMESRVWSPVFVDRDVKLKGLVNNRIGSRIKPIIPVFKRCLCDGLNQKANQPLGSSQVPLCGLNPILYFRLTAFPSLPNIPFCLYSASYFEWQGSLQNLFFTAIYRTST